VAEVKKLYKPINGCQLIASTTQLGHGGAERSLLSLRRAAMQRGYNIGLSFSDVTAAVMVSSNIAQKTDTSRFNFVAQYVQDISYMCRDWKKWDWIVANSEWTLEQARKAGWQGMGSVQRPIIDRFEAVRGDVVFLPRYATQKGSHIFRALAQAMPAVRFRAVAFYEAPQEQLPPNLEVELFQADMSKVWDGVGLSINLCLPDDKPNPWYETYCRAAAESLGLGIPAIVNQHGNLPNFAKWCPEGATLVHQTRQDAPEMSLDEWCRLIRELLTKRFEPWKEAWSADTSGLKKMLAAAGVTPGKRLLPLLARVGGRLGDGVMEAVALQEAAKHRDVYVSGETDDERRPISILQRCSFVKPGRPEGAHEYVALTPWFHDISGRAQNENTIRVMARQAGVFVRDENLVELETTSAMKLPTSTRKRLLLSLVSGSGNPKDCIRRSPKLEYAKQLAQALAGAYDVTAVGLTTSVGDGEHLRDWGGKTSVDDVIALCKQADGIVSTDTGLAHIAAALGKPTVVLVGPVGKGTRYVYGRHCVELLKHCPRNPCWKMIPGTRTQCKDHAKCVEVPPAEVLALLESLL